MRDIAADAEPRTRPITRSALPGFETRRQIATATIIAATVATIVHTGASCRTAMATESPAGDCGRKGRMMKAGMQNSARLVRMNSANASRGILFDGLGWRSAAVARMG